MIKVSVIVPVYNVDKYLGHCVESILNQTYRDIELILIDDGSSDNSPQICDEYKEKDSRVIVIHKENEGLSVARNTGVKYATGRLGIFIDSDDYWNEREGLKKLIQRYTENRSEVICFGYCKLNESTEEKIIKASYAESMHRGLTCVKEQLNFLMKHNLYVASACNKLIDIKLLKRLTFERGKVAEDIAWSAILLNEASSFDYINLLFYCYRQREGSISNRISEKSCKDLKDAIIACCGIHDRANPERKESIGRYTAYQFASFIAVQALTERFPREIINELVEYTDILRYHHHIRKVKLMHEGVKLMGLVNWCRFIRITRFIWDSRRDMI